MHVTKLFVFMAMLAIALCASQSTSNQDFKDAAGKIILSAEAAYDAAMQAAADARDRGLITEFQVAQVRTAGNVFYVSHSAAQAALKTYDTLTAPTPADQSALAKALGDLLARQAELADCVSRVVNATGGEQ